MENTDLSNLWKQNSEYNLFSPFLRISKTQKTLQKLSKRFVIIIDNESQQFVNL
jgi:hypothetical protein